MDKICVLPTFMVFFIQKMDTVNTYQLVEFDEDVSSEKKSIDCVPTSWIEFDPVLGKCLTKFMPPPYTNKRIKMLKEMTLEQSDAPSDWKKYPINIRGAAGKFKFSILIN